MVQYNFFNDVPANVAGKYRINFVDPFPSALQIGPSGNKTVRYAFYNVVPNDVAGKYRITTPPSGGSVFLSTTC